jgi:hypothetical protein
LKKTLSERVNAECETGERGGRARIVYRIDAEDRQREKNTEEPERGNQTDNDNRGDFVARERVWAIDQCGVRAPMRAKFVGSMYTVWRK